MEGRKEGMTPAGQQSTTQTGSVRDSGLSLRVVLVAAPRSANHLSFFPHETNLSKTLRFVLLRFSLPLVWLVMTQRVVTCETLCS